MGMKLIRDKIPQIARKKGETMRCHTANPAEYRHHLSRKLIEEMDEFLVAHDPEELADILEVIRAIVADRGWSMQEIQRLRKQKRKEKGGFDLGIIWERD